MLGVVTGAHLAAVFLAGDSRRAGQPDLVRAFRARALGSGALAGALALGGLLVVRSDARALFDGLTSGAGLACVLVSGAAGLATLALVVARPPRPGALRGRRRRSARSSVGWVFAQRPYVLPPELTLDEAAAPDATLAAVLVGHRGRRAGPRAVARGCSTGWCCAACSTRRSSRSTSASAARGADATGPR